MLKLPDGTVKVLVEGVQRAKALRYTDRSEYFEADAVVLDDALGERVEAEALARSRGLDPDRPLFDLVLKHVAPPVVEEPAVVDASSVLATWAGSSGA